MPRYKYPYTSAALWANGIDPEVVRTEGLSLTGYDRMSIDPKNPMRRWIVEGKLVLERMDWASDEVAEEVIKAYVHDRAELGNKGGSNQDWFDGYYAAKREDEGYDE